MFTVGRHRGTGAVPATNRSECIEIGEGNNDEHFQNAEYIHTTPV